MGVPPVHLHSSEFLSPDLAFPHRTAQRSSWSRQRMALSQLPVRITVSSEFFVQVQEMFETVQLMQVQLGMKRLR